MGALKQIMLCGSGGQGIVLAGVMLGHAAFKDGKWVTSMNSYGAASRGGECRAEVVISDRPISFPHIIEADILIAMYQIAYNRYIGRVKREGGIVIYDDRFVSPEEIEGLRYVSVPATRMAIDRLNDKIAANVIMLGAVAEITQVVTKESLKSAVEENVPQRLRGLNLKAVGIGSKLGTEISGNT